jgi:hypothetical protein
MQFMGGITRRHLMINTTYSCSIIRAILKQHLNVMQ